MYKSPDEMYDYHSDYDSMITFIWFKNRLFYSKISSDTHVDLIKNNEFILSELKNIYGEPSEDELEKDLRKKGLASIKDRKKDLAANYRNNKDIYDHMVMGRIGYGNQSNNRIIVSFWDKKSASGNMLKKELIPCLKALINEKLISLDNHNIESGLDEEKYKRIEELEKWLFSQRNKLKNKEFEYSSEERIVSSIENLEDEYKQIISLDRPKFDRIRELDKWILQLKAKLGGKDPQGLNIDEKIDSSINNLQAEKRELLGTKRSLEVYVSTPDLGTVPIKDVMSGAASLVKQVLYHPTQGVPISNEPKKENLPFSNPSYNRDPEGYAKSIRSLWGQRNLGKMAEQKLNFKEWFYHESRLLKRR